MRARAQPLNLVSDGLHAIITPLPLHCPRVCLYTSNALLAPLAHIPPLTQEKPIAVLRTHPANAQFALSDSTPRHALSSYTSISRKMSPRHLVPGKDARTQALPRVYTYKVTTSPGGRARRETDKAQRIPVSSSRRGIELPLSHARASTAATPQQGEKRTAAERRREGDSGRAQSLSRSLCELACPLFN